MNDTELAAHLADVAGKLLITVRESGMLSLKALGKAGDATANQFLCHALREQRPDDALLSEEEKDSPERLEAARVDRRSRRRHARIWRGADRLGGPCRAGGGRRTGAGRGRCPAPG
jgi:3'-phosphoadenosine 5'-phosphosulfate (PAPS) 3'-phosphatase